MALKLGIDVGGTFTDIILFDLKTGKMHLKKVSSSPDSPSKAFADGINQILMEAKFQNQEISTIVHGTTLATNALIQRKGANVALLTTKGFKDILHIGRQVRPKMNNWFIQRPLPLIPRHLRYEVPERILYTGEIEKEVSKNDMKAIIDDLRKRKISSVAVCFLHSYINPVNELKVKEIIEANLPEVNISISCQILPEFREYERMSTTAINAYIQPLMEDYLSRLKIELAKQNIDAAIHIMQSNGGVMTLKTAATKSVHTILSGPAAGILGGKLIAQNSGFNNVITADMGGTSFDISLIHNDAFETSKESEVNGFPIKVPMIDIITIGAGGGSIAWIDEGGALRVGPQSAGADPGPVCYQKGGMEPTVTDANLVLGRLRPEWFLGGEMPLHKDSAKIILKKNLSDPLGLSIEDVAEGIIEVVNATMVRGIRRVSVERGFDPRNFILESFGGAGPLHASDLARQLKIKKVLVPTSPGLNSAMGLLMADMRYDFIKTFILKMSQVKLDDLYKHFMQIESEAIDTLKNEKAKKGEIVITRSADLRYFGQGHELVIPIPNGRFSKNDLDRAVEDYHNLHQIRFGYAIPSYEVEFVNLRVSIMGILKKPEIIAKPERTKLISESAKMKEQLIYIDGEWKNLNIYYRNNLEPGNEINGPCIIGQMDSTTLLKEGDRATIDDYGSIIISIKE